MKVFLFLPILFIFLTCLSIIQASEGEHETDSGNENEDDKCEITPQCTKNRKKAQVVLDIGNSGNNVRGKLRFTQNSPKSKVKVTGTIIGLTIGKTGRNYHGLHIHESANTTSACNSTGGHFNPNSTLHGDLKDPESKRHSGDFGNIIANSKGEVKINFQDDYITLFGGNSIIGKPLVVHQDEDDLGRNADAGSKATGNSGARVACGIIKLTK